MKRLIKLENKINENIKSYIKFAIEELLNDYINDESEIKDTFKDFEDFEIIDYDPEDFTFDIKTNFDKINKCILDYFEDWFNKGGFYKEYILEFLKDDEDLTEEEKEYIKDNEQDLNKISFNILKQIIKEYDYTDVVEEYLIDKVYNNAEYYFPSRYE